MHRWNLADIIDLEAQLARDAHHVADQGGDIGALEERDRAIGATIDADGDAGGSDGDRLRAWVRAMRARHDSLPGQPMAQVVRAMGLLLVVLGSMAGIGSAAAVLAYDGTVPINVLAVLLWLVALPWLLLVLLLLGLVPPVARRMGAATGPAQALLGSALRALVGLALRRAPTGWRRRFLAGLGRSRDRVGHYARVQRWLLAELSQRFAVAFLLSALIVFLVLVTVSDLGFCWATTLRLDGATVYRLAQGLAAPWAWFLPDAVPSAELVAATRYVRLEGAYAGSAGAGRAADAQQIGGWWPFVAMTLLVWGVLPRLVLWGLCRWRYDRARSVLRFDHHDHRDLMRRLTGDGFADPEPVTQADEWGAPTSPPLTMGADDRTATVIAWAGLDLDRTAAEDLCRRAPYRLDSLWRAGHTADLAADRAAVGHAAAAGKPVLVLVAADEPPVEDAFALLRDLAQVAPEVAVAAVGRDGAPAAAAVDAWRRAVARRGGAGWRWVELEAAA